MVEPTEATLPPLYAPWLREIVGGPIPSETVATCDHCVMLPPEGTAPGPEFFLPVTKCCAYQPTIPNFLAGGILADSDPGIAQGRAAFEERIVRRVGVVPRGVQSSAVFTLLYGRTPNVFGRAPALRCPYLADDGGCGVWRHRPGVCATWYCKHVRGATGFRFWKLTDKLLRAVEEDLSLWCAAELGAGSAEVASLDVGVRGQPDVAELGGPLDAARYREFWGEWEGREKELYLASAKLAAPLGWADVLVICGPRVRVLAQLVRGAGRELASVAIPERLRLGTFQLTQTASGKFQVTSYSPYDPLTMPEGLADALRLFDGRPTEDALSAILTERKLALDPRLVRRLVDFGILQTAG